MNKQMYSLLLFFYRLGIRKATGHITNSTLSRYASDDKAYAILDREKIVVW